MSTELNVNDDDAIEAALLAEDREHGRVDDEAGDEPAAQTDAEGQNKDQNQVQDEAPAQAAKPAGEEPAAEAAPAAAEAPAAEPVKPAGIASKDGKAVLPYAALKGARAETKHEREKRLEVEAERDALRQQLADYKAGKAPEADAISDEYLKEVEADFPQLAPLVKTIRATSKEVETLRASKAPAAKEEADDSDPLQEAIDSVPLLATWQAEDPEKFGRAVAIDRALEGSPKWQGKPLAERFAHVARQVATEFDIQIHDNTPPPTPPTKAKQDPEKAIQSATRVAPNTLSDFKGGAPDAQRDSIDRLPAHRQMSQVAKMSDADIDAWLAKVG